MSGRSQTALVARKFLRHKLAVLGVIIVISFILITLLAPIVSPSDPYLIKTKFRFTPPGQHGYLLGSDELGRDLLSRLIFAGRISLTVGLTTAIITVLIGSVLGALAGYYGGIIDSFIMRTVDVLLSIPQLFILLTLTAFLKQSLITITLVIAFTSWMVVTRMVRGQILYIKEHEFITAARALGSSNTRIIFQEILPNALSPVLVATTLNVANAILAESALSYLGYGIQPPTPSWGNMLNNAQAYFIYQPWTAIFPGLLIALTVLSFNFVGDGLRDALDPRINLN
jgi:peptide/nickel transport system permease protein